MNDDTDPDVPEDSPPALTNTGGEGDIDTDPDVPEDSPPCTKNDTAMSIMMLR